MAGRVELCWVKFKKSGQRRLILSLGKKGGKLIGLEAGSVPDWMVKNILRNRDVLENGSVDERVRWVREQYEDYSKVYMTPKLDNIEIENIFKIGMR